MGKILMKLSEDTMYDTGEKISQDTKIRHSYFDEEVS
jgi:hypothetical protein